MTVVNPKSISGINSITTGSGSDDILTIHTNNGTERLRVDSTGTTKIVTGIVTTLTATTGIVTTLTTNTLTANSTTKVGSGVTLSPDGDVFATGVCTATSFIGNGSGLTNLSTDLVNDTSPQLGGDLASNGHDIKIADATGYDGNNIYMGSDNDMRIHHDGSNFEMSNSTGTIYLRTDSAIHIQKRDGSTKIAEFNADADCELYHNGTKQCETSANGLAFPSGKGIDFSATSDASGATAEVLDDYEEGTFTPTYINLNVPSHATTNYATYTKVGRLVTIRVSFSISGSVNDGSGVGFPLPYAPSSNERVVFTAISDRSGSNKSPFAFINVNQNSNIYAKALEGYAFQNYNSFSGNYVVVTGCYESA